MAHIYSFEAGFCTHPECMVIQGGSLTPCRFPARVFLLRVRNRFWLWDTGYSTHFFAATKGVYQLYRHITPVYFDEREHIRAQLTKFGVGVGELQAVILSHFHADHMAALKDLPRIPIIADGMAFGKLKPLTGIKALKQGFLPKLVPQDIERRLLSYQGFERITLPSELTPFEIGFLIPDSGGELIIVPLDGHAIGHIGVFVLCDTGWQLIASDAAWSAKNYREHRPPSALAHLILYDSRRYQQTLTQLGLLDTRGVIVHLSHESDIHQTQSS